MVVAAAIAMVLGACSAGSATPPDVAPTTPSSMATTQPPETTTTSTVPPPSVPAGARTVVLDVDGLERTYVLTVPASLPRDRPAALVIDMHGLGSDPASQEAASGWAEKAAAEGFVVAQPAARGAIPTWNPQPGSAGAALDIDFLRALIADVAAQVTLDPGRLYASGFSNGGGMAHRLACEAADLVAAIGTVAGQYVVADECTPSGPVAVIAFHGTDDIVVPYRGVGELLPGIPAWAQAWAERDECGPVPERQSIASDVVRDRWFGCASEVEVELYTIDEGPHAWPGSDRPGLFRPTQSVDATALMWEFFAAHARG